MFRLNLLHGGMRSTELVVLELLEPKRALMTARHWLRIFRCLGARKLQ